MSHPDPNVPADLTPIRIGDVWENPVTGERATILELPWTDRDARVRVETTPGERFAHMTETLFGLARSDRSLARVSRNLPAAVTHRAGAARVTAGLRHRTQLRFR
ncbi:MAG TPA: hypothetical protein VEX15_08175 [Nocardioidaceae bacterium]|nr:hypothetical protein [Nocardioidaceae bacterium]